MICLDVLRSLAKSTEGLDLLLADMTGTGDERMVRHVAAIRGLLGNEAAARRFVEMVALGAQAVLMIRESSNAEAFVASRIARDGGLQLGTLSR